MHCLTTNAILAAGSSGRSVSNDLMILALAITIGLLIGQIPWGGMRLGTSGVLFSSLLFGQLGFSLDPNILEYFSSFSLIIFMYAIGLQVGPGFVASLRSEGLRLNVLSLIVIILGAVMAAMIARMVPDKTVPGIYAGAFITTPGLAAAQEAVRGAAASGAGDSAAAQIGLAYSITYPFGSVGPMLVIVAIRLLFRVRLDDERASLRKLEDQRSNHIEVLDFEVTSPQHAGVPLAELSLLRGGGVVFSRLLRGDVMTVPTADTLVQTGDIYRAVGPRERLSKLIAAIGRPAKIDLSKTHSDIQRMDLIVTRTNVLHRTLRELDLIHRTGVRIARLNRAGVELVPTGAMRLAFADRVTAIGPKAGLQTVETELGNSTRRLQYSQLIPIFLGIVLGVMVGSIPLWIPGIHTSVRIGLAGGPLIAAIVLSRLGSLGSLVWYMPMAANQLFRDFGLVIFLACVGLRSGDHFLERATQSSGLVIFAWGCAISLIPVFVVACVARLALRMDFITLSGFIAGAMGSTTALQFAQDLTDSPTPAVPYAAVLPLGELLPILCAQVLAIAAMHH